MENAPYTNRLPTGRYRSECPNCGKMAVWDGTVRDDARGIMLHVVCPHCRNTFDELNPEWQADFTA